MFRPTFLGSSAGRSGGDVPACGPAPRRFARLVAATVLLATVVVPAGGAGSPASAVTAVDGDGELVEVVITYGGVGSASAEASLPAIDGVEVTQSLDNLGGVVATVPASRLDDVAALPGVTAVVENLPVRAANQSAASGARVPQARDEFAVTGDGDGNPNSYSKNDAVAAVLDTGIDAGHPDLDGGKVIGWYNAIAATGFDQNSCPKVSNGAHDDDPSGHGTHVAGTIAGTGEGNAAAKGMAPGAALVGVKVLDCKGDGNTATIAEGLAWVRNNRAKYGIAAVNVSIEGTTVDSCNPGDDPASVAVNQTYAAGLLVVVAAGNHHVGNPCSVSFPGTATGALTVGAAYDPANGGWSVANFSGRGPTQDNRVKPDLVASGIDVLSPKAGGGYQTEQGTSMSTPVVTGVALLLHDLNPLLTAAEMRQTLTSTANNFAGATIPNNTYGYGAVDALAALRAVVEPAVAEFAYGKADDIVLIGDWNGDRVDTPGVRRGKIYHLNNANAGGNADIVLGYGKPDDEVFVGDWNGDGRDTLAVRRKNVFYVRYSITSGPADVVFGYGRAGDEVLVGDWNGDGVDTFAVRRGNVIYTRDDFRSGPATNVFGYGTPTDTLLPGDWDGDGFDTFGVRRDNLFLLKNSNTGGPAEISLAFGEPDDIPLAGDWDGDGADEIGVRDGRIHRLAG